MKKIFTFLFALIIGAGTMFADLREGVLPGEFHVSPTKKVHFSSGNFQSCRNGNRLAEHQYDFVGASNKKISSSWSYNGYFDLFGWGKVYYTYTTDSSAYATYTEWGEYPLSNADNDAQWRTLTIDEWKYLLCSSPAHIGFGTVAEKKGLILLPGGVLPDVEAAGLSFVSIKKEDQWETIVDNGIIGIKILADEMPTGIDQANGQQPTANSRKILRDGQLFILRDGKTFTLQGQEVR